MGRRWRLDSHPGVTHRTSVKRLFDFLRLNTHFQVPLDYWDRRLASAASLSSDISKNLSNQAQRSASRTIGCSPHKTSLPLAACIRLRRPIILPRNSLQIGASSHKSTTTRGTPPELVSAWTRLSMSVHSGVLPHRTCRMTISSTVRLQHQSEHRHCGQEESAGGSGGSTAIVVPHTGHSYRTSTPFSNPVRIT